MPVILCLFVLLSFFLPFLSVHSQDIDFEKAAGGNIGRTAEDDGGVEEDIHDQLGSFGPVVFTHRFSKPGEATFALYSPEGQLVRILGQVIPVDAREYRIRWDGLDLFGNPVPGGTRLDFKVFYNPGIHVTYEMAIRPPRVAPWPGDFSPGPDSPRFGGWLGDHSTPHGAAAVGDTVFLGYTLAEEGSNLVGVNEQGEVVFSHKLEGWDGPSLLNSNGQSLAAMSKKGTSVYRINPEPEWDPQKKRWNEKKKKLIGGSGFQHLTVHEEDLLIIGENKAVTRELPHPRAFSNRNIDYIRSLPQVLNSTPPSDFHISPQSAFGNTFTSGGSPQVGTTLIPHEGYAFTQVVLKEPAEVGTVVIPELGNDVGRIEVLTLKPGVAYKESMAPNAGGGSDDLMSLSLNAQGDEWQSFGNSNLGEPLNWISPKAGTVTTQALLIKAFPKGNVKANWKPRLPMARILKPRVNPSTSATPMLSTSTKMKTWKPEFSTPTGWKGTTEFPISDTYPMWVTLDYTQQIKLNAFLVQDALNPGLYVQALPEGLSLSEASEDDWVDLGLIGKNTNKKLGHRTSSRHFFERYLQLSNPVTTTAIRLKIPEGYKGGKWGESKDDPTFTETEFVQALMIDRGESSSDEKLPETKLYWVDFNSGELKKSWTRTDYKVGAIDFAPDGTLYAVANGRLNTVDWNRETGEFRFTPLGEETFSGDHALFMDTDSSRIAVADPSQHTVRVFDRKGRSEITLGTGDHRKPGTWNPEIIDRPRSVALASNGDIWIPEASFAPKRISRFSRDGGFKEDFLGPPMYGGGGNLDADGKRMFYRGMEFQYDFETGSSQLTGLYDRPYAENTPDAKAFTFGGIRYSNPVYAEGKRYLVGGGIIARKPDDSPKAIPAVVWGYASDHPFLQHEVWNTHWATQNLTNTFFIWCDLNEDGAYQVSEVQVSSTADLPRRLGGGTVGPGLSLWGKSFRWAPASFTAKGVPVFRIQDIQPFDYEAMAAHYSRNYTLSGPTSAKPGYGGYRYVSTDGYLAQEGQPFVVKPDGTILGGTPPQPSDYIPVIPGQVVQTAWSWAGGAVTDSPVGEIAVINSYKGAWHIWGVKHGVMLGRFFTGEEGTFNGMKPKRGMDVTKRYMGWEGWHADFVKTQKGRYLAQGGKSFHSINEVHGLDAYQVTVDSFTLTDTQAKRSREIRPELRNRFRADAGHEMTAYRSDKRLSRHFKLDGLIDDWGDRGQFTFMDEESRTTRFDLSFDSKGLLIAIDGRGSLEGSLTDWRKVPAEGFAIEINLRRPGKQLQRNNTIIEGDAKLYIIKLKDEWRAVLLRPESGAGPTASAYSVPSDILDITADEFRLLGKQEIDLHIRETSLDIDIGEIGGGGGFDLGGLDSIGDDFMLETEKKGGETKLGDGKNWTAEIRVPWALIGSGNGLRRFDIGIRETGPKGRHFHWNNRHPDSKEPAIQQTLNPRGWGRIELLDRKR